MSAVDRYLCQYHAALLNRLAVSDVETIAASISGDPEYPDSRGPYATNRCEQYVLPVLATILHDCEYAADSMDAAHDCNRVYRWSVKDTPVYIETSLLQALEEALAARQKTVQDVPA